MKPQPETVRMDGSESASPCVSICEMDEMRGMCRGCARTLDEIANWTNYTHAQRLAVLKQVALRKAAAAAIV